MANSIYKTLIVGALVLGVQANPGLSHGVMVGGGGGFHGGGGGFAMSHDFAGPEGTGMGMGQEFGASEFEGAHAQNGPEGQSGGADHHHHDNDHHHHYDDQHHHYDDHRHDAARVALGIVAGMAIGSSIASEPPECAYETVDGERYCYDGYNWYEIVGSDWIVVARP